MRNNLYMFFDSHSHGEHGLSPAEIQNNLAMASIENDFVYSDRYGHSD